MSGFVMMLAGLLVTFVVVVVVHELGHLIAGRKLGVRAAEFSVGFGRVLWSRPDRFGTLWQVRLLPLGGFVKFVGDASATSLAGVGAGPVVPGSLASVSLSRRAVIAAAGPVINLGLAVLIFAAVSLANGRQTDPWVLEAVHPVFAEHGFEAGDIVRPGAGSPEGPSRASGPLGRVTYQVERNGTPMALAAPPWGIPLVGSVVPGSAAQRAGLQAGDMIVSIDAIRTPDWEAVRAALAGRDAVEIWLVRNGAGRSVVARLDPQGRLGVQHAELFRIARERMPVLAALREGAGRTAGFAAVAMSGMTRVLLGQEDTCNLHGPVRIAQLAGDTLSLGPLVFAQFLAVISASLALMNLLPVPGLDGGHLLLYAVEGARGRPPSARAIKVIFITGMTLLVFLILTAVGSDLLC